MRKADNTTIEPSSEISKPTTNTQVMKGYGLKSQKEIEKMARGYIEKCKNINVDPLMVRHLTRLMQESAQIPGEIYYLKKVLQNVEVWVADTYLEESYID